MRWGNYYLMAATRISLKEGNVVLWETTLNSSPRSLPWGSHLCSWAGGKRVVPRSASPTVIPGGGTVEYRCARVKRRDVCREPEAVTVCHLRGTGACLGPSVG